MPCPANVGKAAGVQCILTGSYVVIVLNETAGYYAGTHICGKARLLSIFDFSGYLVRLVTSRVTARLDAEPGALVYNRHWQHRKAEMRWTGPAMGINFITTGTFN